VHDVAEWPFVGVPVASREREGEKRGGNAMAEEKKKGAVFPE